MIWTCPLCISVMLRRVLEMGDLRLAEQSQPDLRAPNLDLGDNTSMTNIQSTHCDMDNVTGNTPFEDNIDED